jgi:hypothetical protein
MANIKWQTRPDAEKYEIWTNATVKGMRSFKEAQQLVFENEGGFTAVDGASGAPAIFGINRKWHKEAFDRINAITQEKGEEAGKRAAAEYYKKEFWDKNRIASLPQETRAIVYDGVVNHWQGFANRLVNKAREGATPEQLLDMREKEYRRLAETNPEKHGPSLRGWLNRLDNVEAAVFGGTGTEYDDLPVQDKIRASKDMMRFEQDMLNTRRQDPGLYAQIMGLSDEESIAMQGGRARASLLSVDAAKQTVEVANNLETVDEVFEIADQLKQRGGNNYDLLMRDLRKQKLNPRVESAINLANEDPATYKQHIELFMDAYQMDKNVESEAKLDGQFKRAGYDKNSFISNFSSETEELRELMAREGVDDVGTTMAAYEQLAMAHAIKNVGGDIDDSIEFALAPLLDRHNIVTLNGVEVRIPRYTKSSSSPDAEELALDKDIAQERLNYAVADMLNSIAADKDTDGEFFDRDTVTPVLNAEETGIIFRDALGTPLMDVEGDPYEILFSDMRSDEYSVEALRRIRSELAQMPYAEREKRRKEIFGISDEPFDPHKRRK